MALNSYDDPYTEQVDNFSQDKLDTLRWVSVSSSITSIVFGLVFLYLYINMKTKVFRHHLIFLLIFFDFGKAIVLLWYPARVLSVPSSYKNVNFCDVVGWFTSSFIEGADLAVLALAVHTALLVFRRDSNGVEGGLYKWRFYVYGANILIPALLASLAFIHDGRKSYLPYITWCYLPVRPIWYRLVLSWIPRYVVLITILGIYLAIYIHVKLEYRRVIADFRQSQAFAADDEELYHSGFIGRLRRIGKAVVLAFSTLPGFAYLDKRLPKDDEHSPNANGRSDTQTSAIMEFQRDSVVKFQVRRSMIERQIKSIFIYPFAYFLLWLAPFALQCTQFDYVFDHGPVYWLTAMSAFMMPFNCAVDTIAFIIREHPWRNRGREKIFTKDNGRWVKKQLTFQHEDQDDIEKNEHSEHSDASPKTVNVHHQASVRINKGDHLDYDDYDKENSNSSRSSSGASKSPKTFNNHHGFGPLDLPKPAHINPFSHTTAQEFQLKPVPRKPAELDQVSTASSEGSMDLMEFLR